MGSAGNSYDNGLAETFTGLYTTRVTREYESQRGIGDAEFAALAGAA